MSGTNLLLSFRLWRGLRWKDIVVEQESGIDECSTAPTQPVLLPPNIAIQPETGGIRSFTTAANETHLDCLFIVRMNFISCPNDDSIGPSVQGCRNDFDFTLKFEKIFLTILPTTLFIALSIPRVAALVRRPKIVDGAFLQCTKLAAITTYAVLHLGNLILNSNVTVQASELSTAASALSLVAALCMLGLSFFEHSRSPRPSILLNTFLISTVLLDAAQVRSLWLSAVTSREVIVARTFTAAAAWKFVLIVLESWRKLSWVRWDSKDHSPEETSGLFGLATFSWLNPLFMSGYKTVLSVPDLFPLDKSLSVKTLQDTTHKLEPEHFHGQSHGLARALGRTLVVPLLMPVAPRIALLGLVFCQPFLLEALLNFLADPGASQHANRGYGLIGATFIVYTGIPIANALYWYFQERLLCAIRAYLAAAIYRKTLQAKASTADNSAALTLMSADIERVRMGLMEFHEFWANPIQAGLACWLLEKKLGASFAVPIVLIVLCVAGSTVLMRYIGPRQMAWMERIQKRISHTANVFGNMKSLKISGLEVPVEDTINSLRLDELKVGGRFRWFLVVSVGIGFTPVLLAPVFTLAITARSLDVTTIFTSISYLLLLSEPLSSLFQLVPQVLAAFTCLQRVQSFLQEESRHDFRDHDVFIHPKDSSPAPPVAKIIDGSFGWTEETFVLRDINVVIPPGLTMVVGPVASGKSTFCKALLGETPIAEGQTVLNINCRTVGYCEQVPFLWNASIRKNIVGFSTPVDESRYEAAVEATMLSQDLLLLPRGDQTEVCSDGISLSGGQKQRVSIARALYGHYDLLIFDDVLSALDADTRHHVFRRVFGPSGMLKTRATNVVLCTNFTQHLQSADYVVALTADGTLADKGSFDRVMARGQASIHSLTGSPGADKGLDLGKSTASASTTEVGSPTSHDGHAALENQQDAKDETRIMGDAAVFGFYCRNIGTVPMLFFAGFGVLFGFSYNSPTIWLKFWGEDASSSNPAHSTSFYVGLYALFQCIALGSLIAEAIIGLLIIIRLSGANLHKEALRAVFAAPLRYFSTTDTGALTNLFSQDMTLIDGELPQALTNTSLQIWVGLGSAAVIATSSPFVMISYPFIMAIVYGIQRFYLRTSRQLRLLDLEAKAPLYTNFLDTIRGVVTFRAFGWKDEATRLNSSLVDTSQRPEYLLSMVQRWLSFVLGVVVAMIAVLVVVLSTQLRSNAGFAGASMVSIMSFGRTLANLVEKYTLLETSIGAVARLKSFSEDTPREASTREVVVPPASWPEKALVEIKGVSASYADYHNLTMEKNGLAAASNHVNLALQNLTLTIEPGHKVAVCGRTGSGKSSLVLLLLRLLDPLPSSFGDISIDGLSLYTIDRAALRQRIIAIPQDPVFFPDGVSFRKNLDAFEIATDEECQAALETVRLWDTVCSQGGLEASMNADTLSLGQKQLFSLARAVLRKRVRMQLQTAAGALNEDQLGGLLILDEFSSSVDAETEQEMQRIIWSEFRSYTILMISHRLEMVMDFDRVVILDSGKVVEQGIPRELVEREGSWFKHLWTVGGEQRGKDVSRIE
ncbi:ABC transporter FUM19 [Colletotrichum orbiculare MAFF 240422]|uniref:ABC transporter FUM19 n=1 Tax=Colletotrichum orbiculare (strain 104-T / ATCC 96160 / CBS 514.97 / LARS 414 / MAFF 240422) TaxID=1213857 RepID=A0A484FCE5_COLOR|nr:ABC transporter FUM19 [Colletotrichum orbiculare MAFF 240422]